MPKPGTVLSVIQVSLKLGHYCIGQRAGSSSFTTILGWNIDSIEWMQLCYQNTSGPSPGASCSPDMEHGLSHNYTCLLVPLTRTGIPSALQELLEDPVRPLLPHNASVVASLCKKPVHQRHHSVLWPASSLATSHIGLLQAFDGAAAGSRASWLLQNGLMPRQMGVYRSAGVPPFCHQLHHRKSVH